MADTITVKQLADRAKIKPTTLRRILRSRFPRETKGKSYGWQPDDPQIELILEAVKVNGNKTPTTKAEKSKLKAVPKPEAKKIDPFAKAKKTETAKTPVKPGEIDPATGGTVIDLSQLPEPTAGELKAIETEKPTEIEKAAKIAPHKNSKPIRKTVAQLKSQGVKISKTAVVV